MTYHSGLHVIARAKAKDMAERRYFSHVDPDGYGPNRALQLTGYTLPTFWGTAPHTNYIESISAGYATAQAAFTGWMNSAGHKTHVLAEDAFYAAQTNFAVGYANVPGSPYQKYYVFISAPPDGSVQAAPYAEWLFGYFKPKFIDLEDDTTDHDQDGLSRVLEFALNNSPLVPNALPSPEFNAVSKRLSWNIPLRSDLGSVSATVQWSTNLKANSWSSARVQRVGGQFYVDTVEAIGFLRLHAVR